MILLSPPLADNCVQSEFIKRACFACMEYSKGWQPALLNIVTTICAIKTQNTDRVKKTCIFVRVTLFCTQPMKIEAHIIMFARKKSISRQLMFVFAFNIIFWREDNFLRSYRFPTFFNFEGLGISSSFPITQNMFWLQIHVLFRESF